MDRATIPLRLPIWCAFLCAAGLVACKGYGTGRTPTPKDAGHATTFSLDGGVPDGGTPEQMQTEVTLNSLAISFAAFYAAELRWPNGPGDWDARDAIVPPRQFDTTDTALFAAPSYLPACSATTRGPCWKGPFLTGGTNLGSPPWLDAWDNPVRVALISTNDEGTGVPTSPHGAIVLWSTGPDGVDQTGCTPINGGTAPCTVNLAQLANAQSTAPGSDDIIVEVGAALDPIPFTERLLDMTAASYLQFNGDTTVWPFGYCAWTTQATGMMAASIEIDGLKFLTIDTIMTTAPNPNSMDDPCSAITPSTWLGSYLWADVRTMADPPMLDGWFRPLMYGYVQTANNGGESSAVPAGAIVLWSVGPDGIDQTGCTGGTCARNTNDLAMGISSVMPSDDIIVVVGPAAGK